MESADGHKRVVIQRVRPEIDCGAAAIKRVTGQTVDVYADVFADGHDSLFASVLYRRAGDVEWSHQPMVHQGNDAWLGTFPVDAVGVYEYTVTALVDHFTTWQRDLKKKYDAGQKVHVDLQIGEQLIREAAQRAAGDEARALSDWADRLAAEADPAAAVDLALHPRLSTLVREHPDQRLLRTYERILKVRVDRRKAEFSTWYELFPRSCGPDKQHGTLRHCIDMLDSIADMGFDVLYLPPIHPIGRVKRKGPDNSPVAEPGDPGSPWAIGAEEGGHTAIHPQLGTLSDFHALVAAARDHNIEIALDIAFQCAPDHPWVSEHPQWFKWRPDGTVQYAENPPKKYEDILPFHFETEDWQALWQALRDVVLYWVEQGVEIFRVDNPHTKPFAFWRWLINEVKAKHPDVLFLSEAFTRPKVMEKLAKDGFTQSYTYFTWRNTKDELARYVTELTQTERKDYFRPNFWPNTPDILPESLQFGDRTTFVSRLILAATLSSNYGIYGPPYELCESAAVPGKEEYLHSEKYEIKNWDRDREGNLREMIGWVNRIRHDNTALQQTANIRFYNIENDFLLAYGKWSDDLANIIITIVNLDQHHTHAGWLHVPLGDFGVDLDQSYLVHDLLSNDRYIWQGDTNFVQIDPRAVPAHIFRLHRRMRRESDFDYFL